jgi:predicted Ser/Thr protein kinase
MDATETLRELSAEIRDEFSQNKRVLAFQEWFSLLKEAPRLHARNAPQYLLDTLEYYGHREVDVLGVPATRWNIFDCPFDDGHDQLIGQELVQESLVRVIEKFVRNGRVTQLCLLHGPNGSAKSSFIRCLQRGLESYSHSEEGALYTFNWIFPRESTLKTRVGFGDASPGSPDVTSFASLELDEIDACISSDLHDHPILLIPQERRAGILEKFSVNVEDDFRISDHILHGDLSPRSRQIADALLTAYHGDFERMLRHVQVERLYISPRYRRAAVTVEPQLHVDAALQQITADRSFSALPPAVQNISLYEPYGDLVDGNRGLVEYNDLLEKPIESFQYLLATCEKSSVALSNCILHLDVLFMATSNEKHLTAFKEHPAFTSFKGRIELIRAPYLRDYLVETSIYSTRMTPDVAGKPIAPHALEMAALWAVLTRMRQPNPELYPEETRSLIRNLSPMDKAKLYTTGEVPRGLSMEEAHSLRMLTRMLLDEHGDEPYYEGGFGASPRLIQTLLFNAAHNDAFATLSPLAIRMELEDLLRNRSVYEFLQMEPQEGYYDAENFIAIIEEHWLNLVDTELREAMGLVSEEQYLDIFSRYIVQISHQAKGEKLVNSVSGALEDADERLMAETEESFGAVENTKTFREAMIGRVAAWAIDNPGETINYTHLFPDLFEAMRASFHEKQKATIRGFREGMERYLVEGPETIDRRDRDRITEVVENLDQQFGYSVEISREILPYLFMARYND